MNPKHIVWPLAGLLALTVGCQQEQPEQPGTESTGNTPREAPLVQVNRPDHSPVLARVNGREITQAMLEAYAEERGLKLKQKVEFQRALDNVIDLFVMAEAGRQKDLHNKLRFQQRLAIKENTLLSNQLIGLWVKQHPISDAEIRQEYQRQIERAGKLQYRLHHILVASEQEAQQIMQQLKDGRDFLAIVQDYRQVQGSEAGELGWVDRSQLPAPLAEAVAAMQKGQVSSEPVQSEFGWHVLFVEDTRERPVPELAKVREGIRKVLYRKQVEGYMQELKQGMKIERLAEPQVTGTAPMP